MTQAEWRGLGAREDCVAMAGIVDVPREMLHQVCQNIDVARFGGRFQVVGGDRHTVGHQETQDIRLSAFDGMFDGGIQCCLGVATASSTSKLVQDTVCFSARDRLIKLGMRQFHGHAIQERAEVLLGELVLRLGRRDG